jgi:hypothetical protein
MSILLSVLLSFPLPFTRLPANILLLIPLASALLRYVKNHREGNLRSTIFVVTHLDSKIDDSDTAASEKLFSLFRHQR